MTRPTRTAARNLPRFCERGFWRTEVNMLERYALATGIEGSSPSEPDTDVLSLAGTAVLVYVKRAATWLLQGRQSLPKLQLKRIQRIAELRRAAEHNGTLRHDCASASVDAFT